MPPETDPNTGTGTPGVQDPAGSPAPAQAGSPAVTPPASAPPATQPVYVPPTPVILGTTPPTPDAQLFSQFVPEAYKAKEWVKNIERSDNPREQLFKQWEERESMIGKAATLAVPGEAATPEQIKAFHKQIGVPETAETYAYQGMKAEGEDQKVIEAINQGRSEDLVKGMAKAAHELGITPKQFAALAEAQDKLYVQQYKTMLAAQAQTEQTQNAEIVKVSNDVFGADREKVIKSVDLLLASVDPKVKPFVDKLTTDQRVVVAALAHGMVQKYVREDSIGTQPGTTPVVNTWDSLNSEMTKVMQTKAFSDISHADHPEMVRRRDAIMAQMRQIQAPARR